MSNGILHERRVVLLAQDSLQMACMPRSTLVSLMCRRLVGECDMYISVWVQEAAGLSMCGSHTVC